MPNDVNTPCCNLDQADLKSVRRLPNSVETDWQVFFRQVAGNLEPEEREALPALIQE